MNNQALYVKFNKDRKEKFQLRTEIRRNNEEIYSLKIAEYKTGEKFINTLYKIYKKLSSANLPFEVDSTELIDDTTLKFKYVKGKSLLHELEILFYRDSFEDIIKFFNDFENLLSQFSSEEKAIDDNFEEIFGKYPKNKKYQITYPGILDLNFDNLIRDEKGQINLIDYEWTFDFGIPKRYILYRTIINSFLKFRLVRTVNISLIGLEEYFKFSDEEIIQYLEWETHFQNRIVNKNPTIDDFKKTREYLNSIPKFERDLVLSKEEQSEYEGKNLSLENIHNNEQPIEPSETNFKLFKIHRLCRDKKTIELLKSEEKKYRLPVSKYITGIDLFTFINDILKNCTEDYALLCHDDVILPQNIQKQVESCIKEADEFLGEDNWGVIGNAGIEVITKKVLHHLTDCNINIITPLTPHPQLVESVDGNIMLLNLKNLREKKVTLPKNLSGYHLYDLILSYETYKNGLVCAVSSRLYLTHLSGGNRPMFTKVAKEKQFQDYFKDNYSNTIITSINGDIDVVQGKKQREKESIEDIIDRNIIKNYKDKRFNLHLIVKLNKSEDVKNVLFNSIEMFKEILNSNITLFIHKIGLNDSLKEIISNIEEDTNSFVFLIDNESELKLEFSKYLQFFFSNSNIVIGDTILYKGNTRIEEKRILASSVDNCFTGTSDIPISSTIYKVNILKALFEEFGELNINSPYSILLYSLLNENPKSYSLPFIALPYSSYINIENPSYEKTTIMAELVNRDILPERLYNFFKVKEKEEEEILNCYYPGYEEFNSFKKGLIWRTLEKYRKIKRIIIRRK